MLFFKFFIEIGAAKVYTIYNTDETLSLACGDWIGFGLLYR